MKPTLLSLLSIIFVLAASAQDPQLEWQNTIGGSIHDYLSSIQQTADGGYIVGGISESGISGDKTEPLQNADFPGGPDYWVIKLDIAGNIVWQNTIGGDHYDYLRSIQQTMDGGYILGGSSSSGISGDKTDSIQGANDYWVVKLDTAGNIVWQKTIGGSGVEWFHSMQQTTDGGYILGGYSESGISGDKTEGNLGSTIAVTPDYWVIKLDATGNIVWQNTIGGSNWDELHSIQQTADGGYILGGLSDSGLSGDKTEASQGSYDIWVIKLDNSGNIIWQNTIGGSASDALGSIRQTADGGYILGGSSTSGISGDKTEANWDTTMSFPNFPTSDCWVIKLDDAGNIVWQNTIGGNDNDGLSSIQQTADGGYILGGSSNSGISGDKTDTAQGLNDCWLIKLDTAGNIIWQNTIGGSGSDRLASIQQTADGGFILGGSSSSGISGDKTEPTQGFSDYWVIKLSDLHTISGQLLTETGIPIPGVTVTLSNGDTLTDYTDSTGRYSFTIRSGGNYTITPSKTNDVVTNNGITSIDILLTRRHILGTPLSTPYKIIAADVDASNSVSTLDILLMRSMILQNISAFPNNRLWSFVPSDHVFVDPLSPFPYPSSRTYTNLQQSLTNQDFIGIKLGDVNDSWDPNVP